MKEMDMSDEQTHTYHTFSYFAGDAHIRIDVWYYVDTSMTVNILHVDKNSAVAQLFREEIKKSHVGNNREDIERVVLEYAHEALNELRFALPMNTELKEKAFTNQVWFANGVFSLDIYEVDDKWKMVCSMGQIHWEFGYRPELILIDEFITKIKCPTKEDAMNELKTRFKIECLHLVVELENRAMIG
jgi:hypothetical protein